MTADEAERTLRLMGKMMGPNMRLIRVLENHKSTHIVIMLRAVDPGTGIFPAGECWEWHDGWVKPTVRQGAEFNRLDPLAVNMPRGLLSVERP